MEATNIQCLKSFIGSLSNGPNAPASITQLCDRLLISCDGFETASRIWHYCCRNAPHLNSRLVIEYWKQGTLRPYTAH